MAVKRKLDNETEDQRLERIAKEKISNHATRSEKTSWGRKELNLRNLVMKDIQPREERIRDLQSDLRPMYDKVSKLRTEMVDTCIHPFDHLVMLDTRSVHCKFCGKTLATVQNDE